MRTEQNNCDEIYRSQHVIGNRKLLVDSSKTEALRSVLQVSPQDNVAVCLRAMQAGETVRIGDTPFQLISDVPAFHKFAVTPIAKCETVLRFGESIGVASQAIVQGEHVHTHNVSSTLKGAETYTIEAQCGDSTSARRSRTFQGYRRAGGRVGTRNEIWIIPTVGCVARTAEQAAIRASDRIDGRADGIIALPHPHGCSQLGDDLEGTRKVLASLAMHPNVGGLILLALGCETNQVDVLAAELDGVSENRLRIVRSQSVLDEMDETQNAIDELLDVMSEDKRSECDLSDLVIGLKCGGSDALSGLTANPLLGDMTDIVTGNDGRAILTEIPEIFGAEHLLMRRTSDESVRGRIGALVNDFKDYFVRAGEPVNENPSPGNKAGGITTLEEKSLGAVQKAGKTEVRDVILYGERNKANGLTLLEAPGNDAVSCTALAAAGANIILFTTGRGTPLGFPVPTLKISSNSDLAARKPRWIDFDAGQVLRSPDRSEAAEALLDLIIETASGKKACHELNQERSIAIWKRGVTL